MRKRSNSAMGSASAHWVGVSAWPGVGDGKRDVSGWDGKMSGMPELPRSGMIGACMEPASLVPGMSGMAISARNLLGKLRKCRPAPQDYGACDQYECFFQLKTS